MPTCAAVGCSSRADRFSFKVFPKKDLQRRQIWIDRVNCPGWTPTRHSALCERHFDSDQWEVPRQDGKRKLKETAVPTIFCVAFSNDIVSKDHSYSIPGYCQIYSNDTDCGGDGFVPIEQVKVEVDENLQKEILQEEDAEETDSADEKDEEEGVESIQCTPDISVYPEKGEPDPIEMVDCEENTLNNFTGDPGDGDDPLAISAEDVMKVTGDVPLFQHSQKLLFVPQNTTFVAPLNQIVKGEPVVTGPGEKPQLRMHWTNPVRPPTSPPPLQPLSTSVPKLRVISPEALGVKEAIKVFSPPKLHMVSASIPPKLKVMSSKVDLSGLDDYTSSSEINVRNEPMKRRSALETFFGLSNGSKLGVKSCRDESVAKSTMSKFEFQRTEKKFVSCDFLPSNSSGLDNGGVNESPDKSDISVGLKANSLLPTRLLKSQGFINKNNRLFIRPKGHFEKFEDSRTKEKAVTDKPLWKPVSMDGIKILTKDRKKGVELSLKGKKVFRLIRNNYLKKLIDKKRSIKSCSTLSSQPLNTAPKFQVLNDIQSSSIVVLNPYEKLNTPGKLETGETKSSPSIRKKVKFYKCATCQLSYLTLANLQIHLATHTNHNSSVLSKDGSSNDSDVEFIGQFPRKKEEQYFYARKSRKNTHLRNQVLQKIVSKQIYNGKANKIPEQCQDNNACITNLNALKNTVKRPNELTKLQNSTFDDETKNQSPLRRVLLKRNGANVQGHKQTYQDSLALQELEVVRLKKESSKITEKKLMEENRVPLKDSITKEKYSLREKKRILYKPLKNKIELIRTSSKRPSERLIMKLKSNLVEKFKDDPLLMMNPVVLLSRLNINPQESIKTIDGSSSKKEEISNFNSDSALKKSAESDSILNKKDFTVTAGLSSSVINVKGKVFVGEGGDVPPKWCRKSKIRAQEKISIQNPCLQRKL